MIISASYRTDIPAFYAEWFLGRLRAGHVLVRNPYSGKAISVDLRPQNVTGFVFWTRNFAPLLKRLPELLAHGRPLTVHMTVNAYPRALEAAVIEPPEAIAQMRRLAAEVHPLCPVWRYDPILFSSLTPPEFHLDNFQRLAAQLEGVTDEVVISFAQLYRKTRRNLDAAARLHGFTWHDPPDEDKLRLAGQLAAIARSRGMQLAVCTQPHYLAPGAVEARCIDARRLARIAGAPLDVPLKGNRPGCACHESRDIGEYDTCPHGCAYCYAVRHRRAALACYRAHRPEGESLLPLPRQPAPPPLPLFPEGR